MSLNIEEINKKIQNHIEKNNNELTTLCSNIIKIPSDEPPGDTTKIASFLKKYIEDKGIMVTHYEPKEGRPNLVSSIQGSKSGPHITLLAHLDQFPANVGEEWDYDPYSGEIKEGRILGRGAIDMKGGLSSLTYVYCLLKEMNIDLPGKITLLLVSEEESGGEWGARWMVDNVPNIIGDACINAEPRDLNIGIGQRGLCFLKIKAIGTPAHGSKAGYSGANAIVKIFNAIPTIQSFSQLKAKPSEEEQELLEALIGEEKEINNSNMDLGLLPLGTLNQVSVNIGVVKGGSKVNIVPGVCELEVDMRLPFGITPKEIKNNLERELVKIDSNIITEYLWNQSVLNKANYTSPKEKICQIIYNNAKEIIGKQPEFILTSGFNDSRFFREKGVPSVNYGPSGGGMAAANEYVTVDSLVKCAKVHACSIFEFLTT